MNIIRLENTASTNDYALDYACTPEGAGWEGVILSAHQTAGKGMGSNVWESEAGKNLLFSILIHPDWLSPAMQYLMSMAEACALRDVLAGYVDDITIKWPNDIYWRDRKISGTRIDGNIKGCSMSDMVIGTGINVNQKEFLGDAPNPVSLYQITGQEYDVEEILWQTMDRFEAYYSLVRDEYLHTGTCETVVREYHKHLYRYDGKDYAFEDDGGSFRGRILEVCPSGLMRIRKEDGAVVQYEFKEVKFLQE